VQRLARALEEFSLVGTPSNLPVLQQVVDDPGFRAGQYDTETMCHLEAGPAASKGNYRDLAVIAAVLHELHSQAVQPSLPERVNSGWHREARRMAG
jgi:acetyl-CoA carboxylase biotin carboxylase subunit